MTGWPGFERLRRTSVARGLVGTFGLVLAVLFSVPVGAAELEVGQKAPAFTLHGVDGATYSLEEHLGKRGVVVAWFPKAFTPG